MPVSTVLRSAFACCAVALVSACAGTGGPAAGEETAEAKPVCATEAAIGSSIARRSCHTPISQAEIDPLNKDITLRNQQKPVGLGKPGS